MGDSSKEAAKTLEPVAGPIDADPLLSPRSPLWLAFEAAADMLALARAEPGRSTRIVAANAAFRSVFQPVGADGTAASLVGQELADALSALALAPAAAGRMRTRLEEVLERRVALEQEEVIQTCGGARHTRMRLTPIADAEGSCRYVMFSGRDTTERQQALALLEQSEEKFARAFQSCPAPMSISRLADGRFLDVNAACCKLWGHSREDFLTHNAVELQLWHRPADRSRFFEKFNATGSVRDLEIIIRTRRDARRTVLFSAERVEVGGEPCMVAAIYDITAKRESDEIQRKAEAQLRRAQKLEALGTLAGGVAHDFNNILTAIMGVTSLLEIDIASPERLKAHVDELRQASGRAQALVRQILTFSRRHEQKREVFDLRGVAEEALALVRRGLPRSIVIETKIQSEPLPVYADPNQIHQVLMNLATNAAQAIGDRRGRLTVEIDEIRLDDDRPAARPKLDAGNYARVVVEDSGEGMDEETVERIFEPFFTTKEHGAGTGLGLAVVHGIVLEHDGAVEVDSHPGEGTRVAVYLPRHEG